MEYLQYFMIESSKKNAYVGFKPYYKWNTFNTSDKVTIFERLSEVLNLIINGIPSILGYRSA